MTSNAESGPASGNGRVGASGPTRSVWLHLLKISSAAAAGGTVLCAGAALLLDDVAAAVSSTSGALLVMLFFGISLLVGHFVGRNNPSGAIGMFVATYVVKVVGFAVVMFLVGAPQWLHARWFVAGAVTAVVLWQAAEIFGFSKVRLQIYNDPENKENPDA
ncbi:hypothetical protein CXX84_00710 [Arthrobacter sp. AFG7.2]|uniref:hypothetical protein n=1 Tax=Arthrobacter sp. AFG7.2 TaxID=1688693 RepID=UPI000C9EC568|nr:hypothetical protein [Arthrobacter sp. AFG7.2]PNI10036.1 hypothetical protein CXX84_00710 [Arthrobacter sp. AFG7.2]